MAKRFKFNLKPLLRFRKHEEELKRRDHSEAKRAVMDQNQVLLGLLQDEERTKVEFGGMKREAFLSIAQMRMQEQFLNSLAGRIRKEYEVLQHRLIEEAKTRRDLATARKKVRVLERLRDRRRKSYEYELNRAEVRELDEIGLEMFRASEGARA